MSQTRSIHRLRQIGESKIGCIFWLVVLGYFAFVSWQMVPVKMKSVDLDQFIVRTAERASLQQRNTERAVHAAIMKEADELNLPLTKENLSVKRTGARITVEATYTVPINLVVKTWDWEITHKIQRSIIRV